MVSMIEALTGAKLKGAASLAGFSLAQEHARLEAALEVISAITPEAFARLAADAHAPARMARAANAAEYVACIAAGKPVPAQLLPRADQVPSGRGPGRPPKAPAQKGK